MLRRLVPFALAAGLALAAGCGSGSGSPPADPCPSSCPNDCTPAGRCNGSGDSNAVRTCPQEDKPVRETQAAALGLAPQRLGQHRVGAVVEFTVPPGTASVTIIQQAVSAPDLVTYFGTPTANTAVPLRVVAPDGRAWFDDDELSQDPAVMESSLAYFASLSAATGTLTFPNTSAGLAEVAAAGGLPSGTWRVTVSDYAYECLRLSRCTGGRGDSVYDVTVIPKPVASTGGERLDFTFYLATARLGVTAAEASADPDLGRMVSSLRQLLAGAALTLGSVRFVELPAERQAELDRTGVDVDQEGACAPVGQLLKTSATGDTMNVFLVSNLYQSTPQGRSEVVGIDGTIPTPATVPGTVASGVIVTAADLRAPARRAISCDSPIDLAACGADLTAYIVAHEAGHALGLYHVTESDGRLFDPLRDTARCACESCAPAAERTRCGSREMSVRECAEGLSGVPAGCGGGTNLMFWQVNPSAAAVVGDVGATTPEQQAVLRTSPLVRRAAPAAAAPAVHP